MSNTDDAFLALTLALCMKRKKRRRWSREWLKLREKFTHENLLREILRTEPEDYPNFLRMDHKTFEELLTLLRPRIEKIDTVMRKSIPATQRLSITLRYLASGADFEDLKFTGCIAPRTLSDIIIETCEAINEKLRNNIQDFLNNFQWDSEKFAKVWRKDKAEGGGQCLQIPKVKLQCCRTIFSNSRVKFLTDSQQLGSCCLLGDRGYALNKYLLTPMADPRNAAERLYNESQIRTRNVVERTFGAIIVSTAILHNLCIRNREDLPSSDGSAIIENEQENIIFPMISITEETS
ncbi:Uncharacterized protein OBRU01_21738 [Operophtera brumata]|uniref:Nuclease HARBI1 n=1 Tax=Operophtera brumata TaxID=104452 RepID=A0A0L7KSQ5_OPEBR|nr:Uncharacterized protein OBRU01_21738 [Operophtera brumata]